MDHVRLVYPSHGHLPGITSPKIETVQQYMHEGVDPLRCWRTSPALPARYAYHRLTGRLMYG